MNHMKKNLLLVGLLSVCFLPGCFQTRADIAREKEERELRNTLQQNILQSQKQVEALQGEIGRLQGKLEEMEHQRQKELSTLNSSVSSGREGTDKQVGELSKRIEEQQKAQAALFEELKRMKEENVQLMESLSKKSASRGDGGSAQKKSGKSDYDAAVAAWKAKSYGPASEGFREYLSALPNGKYNLSARYYLGDCLYHEKNYSEAIVELGTVTEKSPDSAWGRKATLRIAQSFKALGKTKDAKAFAQLLVSSAPESAEAKQARKLLQ